MTASLTCARCHNLRINRMGAGFCGETNSIVPHTNIEKEGHLTFWRIPASCPRPDSEVDKREDQVAKKLWVSIPINEITPG